jgi:hypothetical protein
VSEGEADQAEEDNTPAESPMPKYSAPIEAIDLTGDQPAEKLTSSINTVDLTKDDPVPARTDTSILEAEPTMQEKLTADASTSREMEDCVAGPTVVDSDSEEEDECYEEEYEQQDYYESEDGSVNDGSDKENNEDEQEIDEQETDEESVSDWVLQGDSEGAAANAHSDITTSEVASDACERSNSTSTRMFYDNKDIPVSNVRTTVRGLSEASLNLEHCYDGSLSVAWDAGLSDSAGEECSRVEASKPMEPVVTSLGSTLYPSSQPASFPHGTAPQGQATERQPSPSDAAMAKSMGQTQAIPQQSGANFISTSQTINPTIVHHLPNPEWNHVQTATAGNQAKQEFFNARKENRATLCSRGHFVEASLWGDRVSAPAPPTFNIASHQYNGCPVQQPSHIAGSQSYPFNRPQPYIQREMTLREIAQREIAQRGMAQREMAQREITQRGRSVAERMVEEQQQRLANSQQILAHQMAQHRMYFPQRAMAAQAMAANQKSMAQAACSFSQASVHHNVDNMNGIPKSAREESPGIDSTSAFTFNKTKSSKEATSRPSIDADKGLEPKKTLESSAKPPKRKFEELEKEVRDWAEATVHSTGRDNTLSDAGCAVDTRAVGETLQSPQIVSLHSTGQQERSTKRLRSFVEAAGYAALGGLAVGAGLFSVLVATAPEFL